MRSSLIFFTLLVDAIALMAFVQCHLITVFDNAKNVVANFGEQIKLRFV